MKEERTMIGSRWLGYVVGSGIALAALAGCPEAKVPPCPSGQGACPVGSTIDCTAGATTQCGGQLSGSVIQQSGAIQGMCMASGNQTVLCKPMCGPCGAKTMTATQVVCADNTCAAATGGGGGGAGGADGGH
jgi:hypothetical protein